ncbi:MAG TPA: hypothetical protein VIX89_16145 [Bryobacteraceae bacterium]
MRHRLLVSLFRLVLALTLFAAGVAPKKVRAMECTSQVYGDMLCFQCYVSSPLGWIAIGPPEWDQIIAQ